MEVIVNLRYAGIIGETRGESQHTDWTANCPKTVQKNGTKGYKKACFTAWSKGTAYTRDTFFTREKCVVPRARALCARALARARAHARNRSVYRFSANGRQMAKGRPKNVVRLWSVGLDGLQGLGKALVLAILAVRTDFDRVGDCSGASSDDCTWAVGDGVGCWRLRKA